MRFGPIFVGRFASQVAREQALAAAQQSNGSYADAHASFPGYAASDIDLLRRISDPEAPAKAGLIVDFVGSKTRTASVWSAARKHDGKKLPVPIVSDDFHGETIEWVGLAKAILSAKGTFVMAELGAGLGVWSIAGGVAARHLNLDATVYGIEGDQLLADLMGQHYRDNGFEPDGHAIRAAIGAENGVARWPKSPDTAGSATYNYRPVLDGQDDYMGRAFEFEDVPVLALRDLLSKHERWDLLHTDIQGHETAVCRSAIDDLNKRVHWLVVGTHSRKIDGDMIDLMWGNGWVLENEKPAKFLFNGSAASLEAMTHIDGTQVWRNPRLD